VEEWLLGESHDNFHKVIFEHSLSKSSHSPIFCQLIQDADSKGRKKEGKPDGVTEGWSNEYNAQQDKGKS